MKSISNDFLASLSGETTTLATIWKVTRKDNQVFCFTDHDKDIDYSGDIYKASTGFSPTSIETSSQLNVDNLEIEGVITADTITDADLVAGLWDYALIEVKVIDYLNLDAGHMWMRRGRLGEVKTGRVTYYAELRGMFQNLQQTIGRVFTSSCNADFCDSRCKLNIDDFKYAGIITSSTSTAIFADSNNPKPDNYFRGGTVMFTGGMNAGVKMEVKTYVGGVFTLQEAMPYQVLPGDTYEAVGGCDKTFATCKILNNYKNYRGYPNLPGRDKIVGGY